MKNLRYVLMLGFLSIILSGCLTCRGNKDVLFQVSTLNALLEGIYDGDITYKELKKYGDFGIGTFNQLDGEMVGLGGKFYQIKADGRVYSVDGKTKTGFAVVTFFEPDIIWSLNESYDYSELSQYLDRHLPSKNILYAIRIKGVFSYLKTRSVPQQQKPYPKLMEVVKNQPVFEFTNVEGTMVGFWLPESMSGVNLKGCHFHFISEDSKMGGHVLEGKFQNLNIEIDETTQFYMVLGGKNSEFYSANLARGKQAELEKIEK